MASYQRKLGDVNVVIDSQTGNLGVGTNAPTRKLHISSGDTNPAARFENTSTNSTVLELITTGDNRTMYLQTDHIYVNTGAMHFGQYTGDLYLKPSRSGGVGINTTNPAAKLHVTGSGEVIRLQGATGQSYMTFYQGTGGRVGYIGTQGTGMVLESAAHLHLYSGGDSTMYLDSNSNVGIGTTTPVAALHIVTGSGATSLAFSANGRINMSGDGTLKWGGSADYGKLTWDTGKAVVRGESGKALSLGANGTQDYIWIATDGDIGIGTTSPTQKLEVNGNVKVEGNVSASGYFISKIKESRGGIGPYDWLDVGASDSAANRAAAIEIGDIAGAKYAIAGGSYDLTFYKHDADDDTYRNALAITGTNANDGTPDVYVYNTLTSNGRLYLNTVDNASANTDKFLVLNSSEVEYRTSAELRTDLQALTYTHVQRYVTGSGGWHRISRIGRGGARFSLSYTGGNFGPTNYAIDVFKNWSNEATLKVEKFGKANYIDKVRIVQELNGGNSDYYVEAEFSTLTGGINHDFRGYTQYNQGYSSTSEEWAADGSSYLYATDATANPIDELDLSGTDGIYNSNIFTSDNISINGQNTNFNFYNNGTTYLNGVTTIDADTTVNGDITLNGGLDIIASTSNDQLKLKRTTSATGEFNIYTNNDSLFFNNVGQNTYPLTIDADDNVGIGTTVPGANLHINSSDSSLTALWVTNTNTGVARAYFDASNGDMAGSDYMWIGQNDDKSGEIVMAQSAGTFHIKTQPGGTITSRVAVQQDGNVGIGNSSPLQKLSVNGKINSDTDQDYYGAWMDGNTATDGYNKIAVGEWYSSALYMQKKTGQNYAHIYTYNGNHPLILNAGSGSHGEGGNGAKVGIGTTAPSYGLDIYFPSTLTNTFRVQSGQYPLFVGKTNSTIVQGYPSTAGNVYLKAFGTGGVLRTGLRLNAYSNTYPDLLLQEDGGSVGIGTTSPTQKLHVEGNTLVHGNIRVSGSKAHINFNRPGGSNVGAIGWDDTDNVFYVAGHPDYGPTAGNLVRVYGFGGDLRLGDSSNGDVLTVKQSTGNVGIGNTSPGSKLHVSGDFRATEAISTIHSSNHGFYAGSDSYQPFGTGVPTLLLQGTTTNGRAGAVWFKGVNGDDVAALYVTDDVQDNYGTTLVAYSGSMRFATQTLAAEKMIITADGDVGIGTTAPVTGLDVRRSNYSNTTARFGNAGSLYIVNDWPILGFNTYYDGGWKYGGSANGKYAGTLEFDYGNGHFYLKGAEATGNVGSTATLTTYIAVTNGGKVGIGTSAPETELHLENGTAIFNVEDAYQQGIQGTHLFRAGAFSSSIDEHSTAIKVFNASGATGKSAGNYWGGIGFMHLDPDYSTWGTSYQGDHFWIGGRLIDTPQQERSALVFATNNVTTAGTHSSEKMVILPDGKVGIGVTDPAYTLEVLSDFGIRSAANAGHKLRLEARADYYDDTSSAGIWISDGGGTGPFSGAGAHLVIEGRKNSARHIYFKVGDTTSPQHVMLANGNVGIGTTSPSGRLDVNGSITLGSDTEHQLTKLTTSNITSATTDVTELKGRQIDLYAYDDVWLRAGTSDDIGFVAGGDTRMIIKNNGRVGINTDSPDVNLHIRANSSPALKIEAVDASSPSVTAHMIIQGYDGRGKGIFLTESGSNSNREIFLGSTYSGGNANFSIGYENDGTAQAEYKDKSQFYINLENNRIGIGNAAPTAMLFITGSGTSDGRRFAVHGGTSGHSLEIVDRTGYTTATPNVYIQDADNNGARASLQITGDNGNIESLFVSSNGRVGIGTTNPNGVFNSYISATRQVTHNGNGGDLSVISDNNSAPVFYVKGTGTAALMSVLDNTTEVFTIRDGGNVGVNKTTPSRKLEVGGDFEAEAITINNEFTFPTTDGLANQVLQTNGNGTVSWGTVSGGSATTVETVASNTNATRYLTFVDSNNGTAAAETIYTTDGIYVNPSTDTIYATGNIISYASSDRRLKDNLKPIENASEKISKISGYEFDWNDKAVDFEGHDVGVVAQEIEKVLPEVVTERKDGYKAVKYEKIVALLIEGMKEQQKEIEELKERINQLEK